MSPFGSAPRRREFRLLHRAHRRLRPPAFPTTSWPRLARTVMEISRFPCRRRLCMPGSTTTRGQRASRESDACHVAFCWSGEHRNKAAWAGCRTLLSRSAPSGSPRPAATGSRQGRAQGCAASLYRRGAGDLAGGHRSPVVKCWGSRHAQSGGHRGLIAASCQASQGLTS